MLYLKLCWHSPLLSGNPNLMLRCRLSSNSCAEQVLKFMSDCCIMSIVNLDQVVLKSQVFYKLTCLRLSKGPSVFYWPPDGPLSHLTPQTTASLLAPLWSCFLRFPPCLTLVTIQGKSLTEGQTTTVNRGYRQIRRKNSKCLTSDFNNQHWLIFNCFQGKERYKQCNKIMEVSDNNEYNVDKKSVNSMRIQMG